MIEFEGESGVRWSYDPNAQIGEKSGFGQVFRGTGPDGQAVAVKHIRSTQSSEGQRRRREREVEIGQVLASTSAKHVMQTLDVGRIEDDLLLVMPLADRSLAQAIAGGLGETSQLEILNQIAQGLVELAEASVLHRDLKPANVLEVMGTWKLADFGMSRDLLASTDTYTFRGWGTWPYMAPELWSGQPATVKSDLYAFGVLAYEVLTGTLPFSAADEIEFMRLHQEMAPPPLPASVPSGVGRVVLRLMAKGPASRPQDARAVLEAIGSAVKRLHPAQEALSEAAFRAQQRRATEDAERAALAAQRDAEAQLVEQALADLHHLLEEAADQAQEALPELAFKREGLCWYLTWERSRVAVEIWTQAPSPDAPRDDPLLLVGGVYAAPTGEAPTANIVCERRDERLKWFVLRFEAHALLRDEYDLGPRDRPHGFPWPVFAQQRKYMRLGGLHIWTMRRTSLRPEAILQILLESIQ